MPSRWLPVAALLAAGPVHAADTVPVVAAAVSPTAVEIRHQRHPHSIQVLGTTADGYTVVLRSDAKFAVADPKVAAVEADGWVRPLATGSTQISVTAAGKTLTIPL